MFEKVLSTFIFKGFFQVKKMFLLSFCVYQKLYDQNLELFMFMFQVQNSKTNLYFGEKIQIFS